MDSKRQHMIDIVFILSLFCVFIILALFVVVIGADVYKGISEKMDDNYNKRAFVSYVTEKTRQSENDVIIDTISGNDALVFTENENGEEYQTWIYVADNGLREITVKAGTDVETLDSQAIMEFKSMEVNLINENLFEVSAEDLNSNIVSSYVSVQGGKVKVVE